ncbi:MAG TPA: class I tRNA ligase family protein, partial [Anaerolineae bacterium]|nr:class I tRNA ligase family protein [Anaerolineae bacterium]
MKLYNALTQTVEPFQPLSEVVTLYVCGITPYDTTHLGHAFTYATFDVLIRYLEFKGYPVKYVQNVTDIDDDILRKAREVSDDWQALGNRWTRHFMEDLRTLNLRPPDVYPRATETIAGMLDIVQRLVEQGVAYESGGSVYFHVDAWPEFGRLSRIPREQMLAVANERGNRPDDPH